MDENTEFDVVVYGATGFTGRLVVEYLNEYYGNGKEIKWAIAGRSADKLATVRDEIGAPGNTPLIVANSSSPETLKDMAKHAGCVMTTVGPYQLYGEPLVAVCAQTGTDYVDLCGEPLWMRDMIEKYDDVAKESGARIVLSCGFDSIPFEMGVYYLQQRAREKFGHTLPRITTRVRKMKGTFSGGTAASFMASMARIQKEPELLAVVNNPFALANGFQGPAQPPTHKIMKDEDLDMWLAPFIMESINSKNIHRANALQGHAYGEDFTYHEMTLCGPGEKGEQVAKAMASLTPMSENPPKPGEGPSREERESGYYDLLITGYGTDGETLSAAVTGDRDPGYGSTSKMIVEAALSLVKRKAGASGGVLTPSPAMGMALIDRLVAHAGLTFDIEG